MNSIWEAGVGGFTVFEYNPRERMVAQYFWGHSIWALVLVVLLYIVYIMSNM